MPPRPRILDLGCGPGRQTLVLARAFDTVITAVDIHRPYLDQLAESAAAAGLSDRIETRCANMEALEEPPESVDLFWSEGAVYVPGVVRALELWRPLLAPGGVIAFTELSWLTPSPPQEPAKFWSAAYPSMGTVGENLERIKRAGYQVIDRFTLPERDWWDDYFRPLERRIAGLRSASRVDLVMETVMVGTEREIDLYRRHGGSFGYVFYVLRKY